MGRVISHIGPCWLLAVSAFSIRDLAHFATLIQEEYALSLPLVKASVSPCPFLLFNLKKGVLWAYLL
jgi:hypothetical protein